MQLFSNSIPLTLITIIVLSSGPIECAKAFFSKSSINTTTSTTQRLQKMPNSAKTTPIDTTHSKDENRAARFWNRLANYYYKQPIKDEDAYQKKLGMTRKYFTPQSRVLEFGCGTGGTALQHAPYVNHIHAIDFSTKMIDIAKQQVQDAADPPVTNVTFECAGIDTFQASESSYDVVMGMSVLHLLPNKDEILQRVHGMVKPGGYFVSSTACIGDFAGGFVKFVAPPLTFLGIMPTLNVFTKAELKSSIEKAGFSIEEEYQPGNEKDKAVFIVAKKI